MLSTDGAEGGGKFPNESTECAPPASAMMNGVLMISRKLIIMAVQLVWQARDTEQMSAIV